MEYTWTVVIFLVFVGFATTISFQTASIRNLERQRDNFIRRITKLEYKVRKLGWECNLRWDEKPAKEGWEKLKERTEV